MALLTRFSSTCRTRTTSPRTSTGTPSSTWKSRSRFFSVARGLVMIWISSTALRRSKGTFSITIMPASILEKSRISLITVKRWSAEVWTKPSSFSCSSHMSVSDSRPVMPITPLRGVRSSWLMLARNSLLARLARIRACSRFSTSPSISLKASTSCPTSSPLCPVTRSEKFFWSETTLATLARLMMGSEIQRCMRSLTVKLMIMATRLRTPKNMRILWVCPASSARS